MPPKKDKGKGKEKGKEKDKGKGKDKGAKGKDSKKQLPGVEQITEDPVVTKADLDKARALLGTISKKLLEGKDAAWKTAHKFQADTDPLSVPENVFAELVSDLVVKKKEYEQSIEVQVECLESRLTEVSLALARYSTKCRAYENGLQQFLTCDDLNALKDHAYHLMIVAGEAYHSLEAHDPDRDPECLFGIEGITDRPGADVRRVIDFANQLDLIPPCTRYPGCTLIRDMIPELLFYIIKELNIEKVSGADWLTLGARVGIDQSLLDEWQTCQLSNPAGCVFTEWTKACPASVRLLYRHLNSPQMRCTVLCKRIADFYCVE